MQEESQLTIGADENEPPKGRVDIVARILAGQRWPGIGFERLTTVQRRAAYDAAREAVRRVQEVE